MIALQVHHQHGPITGVRKLLLELRAAVVVYLSFAVEQTGRNSPLHSWDVG